MSSFMLASRPSEGLRSKTIRLFSSLKEAQEFGKDKNEYQYFGKVWELFPDKEPKLVYSFYGDHYHV